MICAFIAATRFNFVYDGVKENIQLGVLSAQIWNKAKKAGEMVTRPASFGRQRLEEADGYEGYPSTGYETGGGQGTLHQNGIIDTVNHLCLISF